MSHKNLDHCPILYPKYICRRCKKEFFFLSGVRCDCEKLNKFRNKPIIVNGINFDGYREGFYCNKLSFLESKKIITDLEFHPAWRIEHNKKLICKYIADAKFLFKNETMVIDVKGKETQVFRLKRKLMKAFYPDVEIHLIK